MVTRRVMDLAGGDEALMELFGLRLRTVLTPEGFDTGWSNAMVVAFKEEAVSPRAFIVLNCRRPLPWETELEFWFEGYDLLRGGTPFNDNQLPPSDPFSMLYARVRDLIAEWPEIIAERG